MKSSPNHLCGQTEVVLCALQFNSLETSCFSRRGLALFSHHLTSTSFGWSWWPAAGLQLQIWPPLPLQSADVSPLVSVLLMDCTDPHGPQCSESKYNTGANMTTAMTWVPPFPISLIQSLALIPFTEKSWSGTLLPGLSSVFSHNLP